MALEAWQYKDPFLVLQRKQERAANSRQGRAARALADLFKEPALDHDTSEAIESLLAVWYGHESAYMPRLGAPRVSPSCRGYDSGEIHSDGEDRDALLNRITAESVAWCIDQLHYLQRAAINVHCRNKQAGMSIHRNPRIEEQHTAYQEAKGKLWPIMKRRGLV